MMHSCKDVKGLDSFTIESTPSYSFRKSVASATKNQESKSEAVNAYYSTAAMGIAYEDRHLVGARSIFAYKNGD
ncbi:hypothetical protein L1987_34361 [Smallanthus sonchifolius]|uniref:Uncharacterized protein n=1 Tax=Smallanthus sonchifolius TaxID=185202 RepID=A0ACB9HUB0_9ASTR|nr:hypothetical protein L1987_34361 [Smallanthus sonchifolius]